MPKVRKTKLSFLYATRHLILFYISNKYHQNILKDVRVTERITREIMPKVRMAGLSFLYHTHYLVLFYISSKLPSKYSEGYSSYRADTKPILNKKYGDITKRKPESCHSCTLHVVSSCSTLLSSIIKIFQRIFKLQSRQEILR